ncbi:Hsp33 family molecular chaperone HslO [Iodobacter fluviatilis]|uniref:33 kDa chaperonin n=1 Tax=Iodobacter fluviatilis TaxID=537 RepID=A0A377Q396_9NEIS|nr:Hsp33 family molecular chaperone HslO [Iodobacter fluviatilis]TCU90173.1 molecular chaperone Hsp33 [Iodobacter fluviatilis]STQ89200.1 Heat shock protein 33 [Iodobacter fluviatilis]
MKDSLERFLFDGLPVRGEIVQLDGTYKEVLTRHPYPPVLQKRIGELLAAAALLTATIKLDGTLVMQLRGNGPLKMLVVECTSEMTMRATARWEGLISSDATLAELIGQGQFSIMIDPQDGETWQGVVGFEKGQSVAEIIENYMQRSEQLDTKIWLAADGEMAGGLLIQKLPEGQGDVDGWDRVTALSQTIQDEELLSLPLRETLYRLYNEEKVRIFDPVTPSFACTCSRERVGGMLKMLGKEEIEGLLAEHGHVDVGCEFCNEKYQFDQVDVTQLFIGHGITEVNPQLH